MSSEKRTVYVAIKFHADHSNRALVDRISAAFEKLGVTTVCVARDMEEWGRVSFDARDLMRSSLDAVRSSDAVVVEFSEKGVGLGIEAGYATALDVPVFVLLRPGAELSTTLEGISTAVYRYVDDDDLDGSVARIVDQIDGVVDRS